MASLGIEDVLTKLTVLDRSFLSSVGHLLVPDDVPERGKWWKQRIVYGIALSYWSKYEDPIGDMLGVSVSHYLRNTPLSTQRKKLLTEYVKEVLESSPYSRKQAIVDVLGQHKKESAKREAVEQMSLALEHGKLSDQRWLEISEQALKILDPARYVAEDFFQYNSARKRAARRGFSPDEKRPFFLIDPLDALVKGLARGEMGLVMGPWKRGKSQLALWIAVAYAVQGLRVLFVTLEDSGKIVEDRLDANITGLTMGDLYSRRRTFKQKFEEFRKKIRGNLRVIDATAEPMSVQDFDRAWEENRRDGFPADAVFVDYDDEILPPRNRKERRQEFADVYRELRRLAARRNVILWTLAQTQRSTEHSKIISGGQVAEDISKVRKVTMALGLGKGDWGDGSLFLWVAAHKLDKQDVGCNIMSDLSRSLIYDQEKTRKVAQKRARE